MTITELKKRLEFISKQILEDVPKRIEDMRKAIEQLSKNIQDNGIALKRTVQGRENLDSAAGRKLCHYRTSLQVFDFNEADQHLEKAGWLIRQAVKLSETIAMASKKALDYKKQAEGLGVAARDIYRQTEFLTKEASRLHGESQQLLSDIGIVENDIKDLRTSAKEES